METTNGDNTVARVASDVQTAGKDLLATAGEQISGTANELSGKARQLCADFTDVVRESTVEKPFAALAIAASVGFILGALHASSRSVAYNNSGNRRERD
ncbi:hypothetical protein [Paraburkholderia phytofirmans]|uniref:CsbD family protein n=1 Tax=Paraburkholderia phytofirmans (strain DSM 17436 / LMG 22146 / PsJN) TaxID=398527 RepID=B2T3F7_PARPJ|nr:hypothetical protein [Paraburkholderia phytofirmans]ACD16114.1 conserved hypothetical protein [Paraburkholderia phytofirmans PsJN]